MKTAVINTPEIEAEIAAKRAGRLATAPSSWHGILKRSWTGNSRKTAIKAFCGECQGFDRAGIADCTAYACPIWKFRPFQSNLAGEAGTVVYSKEAA